MPEYKGNSYQADRDTLKDFCSDHTQDKKSEAEDDQPNRTDYIISKIIVNDKGDFICFGINKKGDAKDNKTGIKTKDATAKKDQNFSLMNTICCMLFILVVVPGMGLFVHQIQVHANRLEEFDKLLLLAKQDIFSITENLKADFRALETQLKDAEKRYHMDSRKISEKFQKIDTNMSAIIKRFEFTSKSISYINRKNKQNDWKFEFLIDEIRVTRMSRKQTRSEIAVLQRNVYTIKSDVTKKVVMVKGLKKDIDKLEWETKSNITIMVGKVEGLKKDIDKLDSDTKSNITIMVGKVGGLKKEMDKLYYETKSNVTKMNGKMNGLNKDMHKPDLETNVTNVVVNVDSLKKDQVKLESKQETLEKDIDIISSWENAGFGVMMIIIILFMCVIAYKIANLHNDINDHCKAITDNINVITHHSHVITEHSNAITDHSNAITDHSNVIEYLIKNKEYQLQLESYSILKDVICNRSGAENSYCVISFDEAAHKKHGRIVRYSVEGRGRVKNMLETNYIIKEGRDVLNIPNVKVMLVCVDRNETNSILETSGQYDRDIRLLTVHACCKMGADVFVIYVGDPGSKDLMAGLLYNTQLTTIVEHFMLKKLEKKGRVISVYEKFTITQRERVAGAIA